MFGTALPKVVVTRLATEGVGERMLVGNRSPAPGEATVSIDAAVHLEVFDLNGEAFDVAATRVWVGGVLAFDAMPLGGFDNDDFDAVSSPGRLALRLRPPAPFASEALIEVSIETAAADGGTFAAAWSFEVEDRTAPVVLAAVSRGPRDVTVLFDEPVSAPEPTLVTLAALTVPAVAVQVVSATADGNLLHLRVAPSLTAGARYEVDVSVVEDLRGNAALPPARVVFDAFAPPVPALRRFDIWKMLPAYNRRIDESGDLRRFIGCLQEIVDRQLTGIDRFTRCIDIERADEPFIDAMLADLGNPFFFELRLPDKRRLAASLVDMYRLKGTTAGLARAIRFFVGVTVTAITPHAADALTLGEAELGVDFVLGPSSHFARYAFDLHVGVVLTPTQRRWIRDLADTLKPAHTHFIDLVEPGDAPVDDGWVLGVAEIGDAHVS